MVDNEKRLGYNVKMYHNGFLCLYFQFLGKNLLKKRRFLPIFSAG